MGKTTDDLIRLAGEVSSTPPPREYDMLVSAGERVTAPLLCMALADFGVAAVSFTGSQAGIITTTEHGAGQDHRGQGGPAPRGARRGNGAGRGRLPGRVHRPRRHHARARRLGHDRRRTGGGPRCVDLRDLHGRDRRLQRRPPRRARGAPAGQGQLRRDARDRRNRWSSADAALGRVRPAPPCDPACSVQLHLGARDHRDRGGFDHGTGCRDGRHPRHLRGQGHGDPGAGPARGGGAPVPRRWPTGRSMST